MIVSKNLTTIICRDVSSKRGCFDVNISPHRLDNGSKKILIKTVERNLVSSRDWKKLFMRFSVRGGKIRPRNERLNNELFGIRDKLFPN